MTIEEIKSVSIVQFLESQGYHHVYILKQYSVNNYVIV